MIHTKKLSYIVSILFVVGFVLLTTTVFAAEVLQTPSPATEKPIMKGDALKLEKMTKDQFKALPDSTLIQIDNRQMTKGQYFQEVKMNLMKLNAEFEGKGRADFEKRKAQFLREEQAKIDAQNARVLSEFESMRQREAGKALKLDTIRNEALQLQQKSRTATPAEKAQLEKRAGELMQQLKQLGY